MKNLITEQKFNEILATFDQLKPLLVVGDVGIDKYTFGEVKRISPEAPVPVLEVTKEWLKLGLAANISHNLQTLQIPSTLCGIIGEDKNADVFEDLLEDNHLKTWGLIRSSDRPTTFKERVTTNTQQICRIDYESSESINDSVAQKFISRIEELSKTHSAIILEDYAKGDKSATLYFQLELGKLNWRKNWPMRWAHICIESTCRNIWKSIRWRNWWELLQVMWAMIKVVY